ncbi:MAG: TrbG/VirB9 family P-type conjugative transfer protein [Bdellovibrionales bacterium]
MFRLLLGITLPIMFLCIDAWAKVRHVPVEGDQIVNVKTTVGIATIIQVPDRPNSVVVGDQEAFKVEYLDQAITIKPLYRGAKSNLYIYTDWKRFNVLLVPGDILSADYVVYLESAKTPEKKAKPSLRWTNFKNKLVNDALTVETKRLGQTKDGILIVEFRILGLKKEKVKADWLWLTQGGQTRPIHNLFLSNLEVRPDEPIDGMIQIIKNDLNLQETLRVELRRKKNSYLTIPKVSAWK